MTEIYSVFEANDNALKGGDGSGGDRPEFVKIISDLLFVLQERHIFRENCDLDQISQGEQHHWECMVIFQG